MARRTLTIAQVMARYMEHARDYYRKPGSRRLTGEHRQIHYAIQAMATTKLPTDLRPDPRTILVSLLPADDFRQEHLALVQRQMVNSGLARKTVNARIARIRRMFRWAAEATQRYISAEVVSDITLMPPLKRGRSKARDTGDVQPVEWETVTATMAHANLQLATMIELAWWTGMRPGELVSMRLSQIDRSEPVWVYTPATHKNEHHGHDRHIFIGAEAQSVLAPWLHRISRRRREQLWTITRTETLRSAVWRINTKHGIPHWFPNQLRHSCGARLTAARSLHAAQVVLGHARISTTQIYAKYAKGEISLAAQVMAELG